MEPLNGACSLLADRGWNFGHGRKSEDVARLRSSLFVKVIDNGRMDGGTVVKDHYRFRLPANSSLEIMALQNVVKQKIRQCLELRLLESLESCDEFAIDEDRSLAGDRMNSNERVYRLHRVFANQTAECLGMVNHVQRRMNGLDRVYHRSERWGETFVSLIGSGENSITSDLGTLQKTQHHVAWRLAFVADILMP